ncbi:MAG: hypothetical protein R2867_20855 [Caldilineaceae bacterium]
MRYEQYKLALTDELLATIFGDDRLAQTLSDGKRHAAYSTMPRTAVISAVQICTPGLRHFRPLP